MVEHNVEDDIQVEYIRSRLEHVISFHFIHFRSNHRQAQTREEI